MATEFVTSNIYISQIVWVNLVKKNPERWVTVNAEIPKNNDVPNKFGI